MPASTRLLLVVALAMGAAVVVGLGARGDAPHAGVVLAPRAPAAPTAAASSALLAPSSLMAPVGSETSGAGLAMAARAYASAELYAQCERQSRAMSDPSSDPSIGRADADQADPSGAMAARLERDARSRVDRCRLVGPDDYRRVDALLRQAAEQGSAQARLSQWRRRLDALLTRTGRADVAAQESPFTPEDAAELKTIAGGIETLALSGQADAMEALQQLLSSGALPGGDPVRAAAWRLVSYQVAGREWPPEAVLPGRVEVLDDLDDATRAQVLALSRSLFDACCRR